MTALALPVAFLLGALASLVAAGVRRLPIFRKRRLGGSTPRDTLRRFLRGGKHRPSPMEMGGALGCFLAAGIAGGAALGASGGSAPLLYLALLAAAAGGHVAAADPTTELRAGRMGRARLAWALAEPAFLVALGTVFLRWRADDLVAVRGAQEVLGTGITVGPPAAAAGVWLAAVAFLVAGAVRLVPASESVRGGGRRAGAAVVLGLCRWAVAGVTAMVAGVLAVGGDLASLDRATAPFVAAAMGAAVVVGAVDGLLSGFPRTRTFAGPVALALGAVAVALVALG